MWTIQQLKESARKEDVLKGVGNNMKGLECHTEELPLCSVNRRLLLQKTGENNGGTKVGLPL